MKNTVQLQNRNDEFPKNVVVLATHGSFFVPDGVRRKLSDEMCQKNHRGTKNFSDFVTRKVIPDNVPPNQKVIAGFSRAIGDPNRSRDAQDLFRDTDFGGLPVWKEALTDKEKQDLLKRYYDEYHKRVLEIIENTESENERVIIFDIHDTGNLKMSADPNKDTQKESLFPEICLGYRNGESCDPQILRDFAVSLENHLGITPKIDDPYSGGYVTQFYGEEFNKNLPQGQKFKRNVIQIELGRYLYMDEKTQKIDGEKLKKIEEGLEKAMKEVGCKYGKK